MGLDANRLLRDNKGWALLPAILCWEPKFVGVLEEDYIDTHTRVIITDLMDS